MCPTYRSSSGTAFGLVSALVLSSAVGCLTADDTPQPFGCDVPPCTTHPGLIVTNLRPAEIGLSATGTKVIGSGQLQVPAYDTAWIPFAAGEAGEVLVSFGEPGLRSDSIWIPEFGFIHVIAANQVFLRVVDFSQMGFGVAIAETGMANGWMNVSWAAVGDEPAALAFDISEADHRVGQSNVSRTEDGREKWTMEGRSGTATLALHGSTITRAGAAGPRPALEGFESVRVASLNGDGVVELEVDIVWELRLDGGEVAVRVNASGGGSISGPASSVPLRLDTIDIPGPGELQKLNYSVHG